MKGEPGSPASSPRPLRRFSDFDCTDPAKQREVFQPEFKTGKLAEISAMTLRGFTSEGKFRKIFNV